MTGMGVDIRVPASWEVESKAVEGKKCIGTHSGSCEFDCRRRRRMWPGVYLLDRFSPRIPKSWQSALHAVLHMVQAYMRTSWSEPAICL